MLRNAMLASVAVFAVGSSLVPAGAQAPAERCVPPGSMAAQRGWPVCASGAPSGTAIARRTVQERRTVLRPQTVQSERTVLRPETVQTATTVQQQVTVP